MFNIPFHDLIKEFIIRSGLFADRRSGFIPAPLTASLQKIQDSQDAFPFTYSKPSTFYQRRECCQSLLSRALKTTARSLDYTDFKIGLHRFHHIPMYFVSVQSVPNRCNQRFQDFFRNLLSPIANSTSQSRALNTGNPEMGSRFSGSVNSFTLASRHGSG